MGLASVLQTALSGMTAAEAITAVVGNNLANLRTPGYKASSVELATETPRTESLGSAPTGTSGGSNPIQVGSGVTIAAVSTNFTQGQIVTDSNPLNLAIEGQGLFILEGPQGERVYSRDGRFTLNSNHELVSADGFRLVGFGVDDNFNLQRTQLRPLRIPQGRTVAAPDGSAATLTAFSIGRDGRIQGRYSDGRWRDLGQIRVARFANSSGLAQRGRNVYAPGPNSGLPVESDPGEDASGTVLSGATEMSNTDLGQSLIDLQMASTLFRANLHVYETGVHLLDELMNLRRADR